MNKKILYVDMDDVLVNFQSWIDKLDKEILKEYENHLDDVPGIFLSMEPLEWAIEAYKVLSKHFDTYILSTSPWKNPTAASDKFIWVQKYLWDIAYKRLIISHHKNLNKWDFLIDDRTKNWAWEFEWELIQFWNDKFPNWEIVVEYLLNKA